MRQCHPKALMWQGVPRFQRGALSPTGLRHVVLRAGFDRIDLATCYSQIERLVKNLFQVLSLQHFEIRHIQPSSEPNQQFSRLTLF